jgi:predicted methyltransferase
MKRETDIKKSKVDGKLFLNVARKDIIEVKSHYEAVATMNRHRVDLMRKQHESQSSIISTQGDNWGSISIVNELEQ